MEYKIALPNGLVAVVTFRAVDLPEQDYDIDVNTMKLQEPNGDDASLQDFEHDEQASILEMAYETVQAYIDVEHKAIYKALGNDYNGWLH